MTHVFKEYQTVILKDLKNAKQYNGKVGTIESKLENGRYQILLHEPLKRLSIHPKNLKHHVLGIKGSSTFFPFYSEIKGWGLRAAKPITRGSVIMHEKPLIALQKPSDTISFKNETDRRIFESFGVPDSCIRNRNIEVFQRNAIPIQEATCERVGIFPTICRINHDCCPNMAWVWDSNSEELFVIAQTDILEGEELCANYIEEESFQNTTDKRREILFKRFGFLCHCHACSTKEKDENRELLKKLAVNEFLILQLMMFPSSVNLQEELRKALDAREIIKTAFDSSPKEMMSNASVLACCYYHLGKFDNAVQEAKQYLKFCKLAFSDVCPKFVYSTLVEALPEIKDHVKSILKTFRYNDFD